MRSLLSYFLLSAAWAVSFGLAEEPFDFERTPGQLPKAVIPLHYKIRVEPELEAARFSGQETIVIEVRTPVKQIVLNTRDLTISRAALRSGQNQTPLIPQLDEAKQTLTLPIELAAGKYELDLDFSGQLNERPQGLYFTRYQDKRALSSQMEATDARRMFPCWDEPVYRATFQLTVVLPEKLTPVSNMPVEREQAVEGGRKETTFAKSPKMSSYLLHLCAAEFEVLTDEVGGVTLRIFTTPGKRESARYAMEATKQILPYYENYFGTRYPLPKLDQIALNNTGASGMENWGAILYDETALLFDPATSSQSTKERVYEVVAHEIAHQWFGNLVTMAWWDNLWLNEGFASWLGTKATDHFNPEWQCWLRAAGDKEWAMHLDARSTTHPIQQPIENESAAGDAFDQITYNKGQAFLRMLESWLGEETFRAGIRKYFQKHAYSNTTTADLWTALEQESKQPVREMARNWVEKPGFPVIYASLKTTVTAGVVQLSQKPFTIRQSNPLPQIWNVPIVFGTPGATPQRYLLTQAEGQFSGSPIKANFGDVGYFRVAYDPQWFAALSASASGLSEADRLNLLNDTWALVQAKMIPVSDYLTLAKSLLPSETSYPVLSQIIGTLRFIDALGRDSANPTHISTQRQKFRQWVIVQLKPHLERIGWEPQPGQSALVPLLRSSLVGTLGELEDPAVLTESRARFQQFLKNPQSLTGDLRSAVIRVVAASEDHWQTLYQLAKQESSTELRRQLHSAMAASTSPENAAKTLALSLTDELIPAEAASLVRRVADTHPVLALAFAQTHLKLLLSKVAAFGSNGYIPGIYGAFDDASRADELEAFAKSHLPEQAKYAVDKAADEIRFKAELKLVLLPAVTAWLESNLK